MWHKAIWKGHRMRLELTRVGLLVELANYYTTTGASLIVSGALNKFPDFFVQAFKIVVDSWKFSMLFLKILWDDWTIFMITGSN